MIRHRQYKYTDREDLVNDQTQAVQIHRQRRSSQMIRHRQYRYTDREDLVNDQTSGSTDTQTEI